MDDLDNNRSLIEKPISFVNDEIDTKNESDPASPSNILYINVDTTTPEPPPEALIGRIVMIRRAVPHAGENTHEPL